MSKRFLSKLADAVTHSGPGYDPPPRGESETKAGKVLDALTHDGPGYQKDEKSRGKK